MLKIVQIPNPVLTSPTQPITTFDDSLKKLIVEMEETLDACVDPQGVGLAAPQVGKNIALFITKPTPKSKVEAFINPKIVEVEEAWPKKPKTKKKKKKETPLEGCLSVPQIWSPLKRAYKVHLEYQDPDGKKRDRWFKDFDSIIIQHEVDHLEGVLFTQRALEQKSQLYEEKDGELVKLKTI